MPTIKLLILEYKNFVFCYTTLVLSWGNEVYLDIKYGYILLFINNVPNKLIKYLKLILPQFPIYTTLLTINSILY